MKQTFKFRFLMKWLWINLIISYVFTSISLHNQSKTVIIIIITILMSFVLLIKFVLAIIYYLWYYIYFTK